MTTRYQKVLLAVDFHNDSDQVIDVARDLQERYGAELHIAHVLEPISTAYMADGVSWGGQVYELEASIRKDHETRLQELGAELGLTDAQCHLLDGRPASRIHDLCSEGDFDLIVLGTHGQHGLQLLLGSTANGVLHGSPCDVLCVRLKS